MADSWELKPHPVISKPEKPVMVCVLDGWGENPVLDEYNAIHSSETPITDSLKLLAPDRWRTVQAHGTAVGLPTDDDMGNSEVGHNALGAGQLIAQGARLVDMALASGEIFQSDGWNYISSAFEKNTLHLIGLLSDGGVHSRLNQLEQILDGAAKSGAKRVRIHILTDGRDVEDGSSAKFVAQLKAKCEELTKSGMDTKIASGGGRMGVTMDRYEADWNIVRKGWEAHVLGEAPHKFTDAEDAVKTLRGSPRDPVSDQWLPPFVITDAAGAPVGTIEDDDAVVIFNFRADRVVEISKALEYEDFNAFDRKRFPKTKFAGLMQYDGDLKLPSNYLVPPPAISKTSGEYLVKNGVTTFACSETQKFGHVTFFWNGNRSGYFDESKETYVEIPSDNLPFNEAPLMKAREICEAGKEALRSGKYNVVRVNFANPDMVGHTGDLKATRVACAIVDQCVGELLEACKELGCRWLLTADHGNADDMVQRNKKDKGPVKDKEGTILALTSHTLAPVPVAIGGADLTGEVKFRQDLPDAGLANVTATYLNLLGFQAPEFYEPSLIA
uniref:phosphoglycerate mutase (2,3-diphosphoglycerate-independent) n=1 Tax=Tetraselmis sp. GSL018 TaxID=582737 RepID=A0A061R7T5_9CHLO